MKNVIKEIKSSGTTGAIIPDLQLIRENIKLFFKKKKKNSMKTPQKVWMKPQNVKNHTLPFTAATLDEIG